MVCNLGANNYYCRGEVYWDSLAKTRTFVNAMHKILHLNYSDDFVIATGKKHNVSEFLEIAFRYLDLEWGRYVEEDQSILKRRIVSRVGNPSKLQKATGWKPSVDFKEMIKVLLRKEGAFD